MSSTRPDPPGVQTVCLVGSYVPRQCGIATFSKDLRDAIAGEIGQHEATAIALDDGPESYAYPREVRFQVPAHKREEYRTAADLLNINQIDVVLAQHEFGIFGGPDGAFVIDLMRRVRMPLLTTLHTVLREPSPGQRAVMKDVIRLSDRLVVMTQYGSDILHEVYGAPREKVCCIPHGIPDVPFVESSFYKDQFGFEGRTVLLSFGLLGPGKGIEVVIQALPRIVREHPQALYVVLGATHPHVLKREGNAYRHNLERLAARLGVLEHVVFHNRFVSLEELTRYIGAADVFITAYRDLQQITSGTLAYSLGAGKAVISTPYIHAREMLGEDRGRLFPVGDSDALAEQVLDVLGDDVQCAAMRKRGYIHCRQMVWQAVARAYLREAALVHRERREKPRAAPQPPRRSRPHAPAVSDLDLRHLFRMTDGVGMFQHAIYSIPDRHHGYCVDDNARALVAALMAYDLQRQEQVLEYADVYLSFLYHGFNQARQRFRNFMSYDRRWLEEQGSEDVHGRALWALGMAAALAPNEAILSFSTRLFHAALSSAPGLTAARAWAFSLVGIHAYLQRFGGDTFARRIRAQLAERLHDQFKRNAAADWPWCEDIVTYDNAKLPHALILAGQWVPHQEMLEQGLRSLSWLVELQLAPSGVVSVIGNDGWYRRGGPRARFDQQPIEAMALVEACAEAYSCTQDEMWRDRAQRFLEWFIGANDTQSVLYDYHTGGCRDGLHSDGPNLNEGAESTLAWLISLMTVMHLERRDVVTEPAPLRESDQIPDMRQVGPLGRAARVNSAPRGPRPDSEAAAAGSLA